MVLDLSTPKIFLITGGCGFIGSHFIDVLMHTHHKIINIDKLTYASHIKYTKSLNDKYHFIKADIAQITSIPYCDIIINFAAESHVDRSINNSSSFITSNFLGVHNLLELLVKSKIDHNNKSWAHKYPIFFQISTDEVFGDILEGAFNEQDKFNPSNPYAASKACAELLIKCYSRTYDIPYVISRTTNNYGIRQHPEKLIPMCITKILRNQPLIIHGSGKYIRNWINVQDNVNALLTILNKGNIGESYHISSNEEYSVNQIVNIITKHMNSNIEIDNTYTRSGVDLRYALDCTKLKSLGWKQQYTLQNSLPEIIEFYKGNNDTTT